MGRDQSLWSSSILCTRRHSPLLTNTSYRPPLDGFLMMKYISLCVFSYLALLYPIACPAIDEMTAIRRNPFSLKYIQVGTSSFSDEIGGAGSYKNIIAYFREISGEMAHVCPEGNTDPTQPTGFLIEQSDQETANYLVSLAAFQRPKFFSVTYQCVQISRGKGGQKENNSHFAVIKALRFVAP